MAAALIGNSITGRVFQALKVVIHWLESCMWCLRAGMGNICNNKAAEGSPSDPRALPGLAAASIGSIILRAIDNKTENSPCIGLSSLGSRNLGSSTKR
jgi:hypothetical protein